jgi:hypothetical protein
MVSKHDRHIGWQGGTGQAGRSRAEQGGAERAERRQGVAEKGEAGRAGIWAVLGGPMGQSCDIELFVEAAPTYTR